MKKITKSYIDKSTEELASEADKIKVEIAKLQVEKKTNPQKDTNTLFKKKKSLAVLLTIMSQKKK